LAEEEVKEVDDDANRIVELLKALKTAGESKEGYMVYVEVRTSRSVSHNAC
jgi:hypothetical protein